MPLLPVLTIILPLVGAGGTLGLSSISRARPYTRYTALTAVGLTTILILTFGWTEPVVMIPSLWQPSLLFGAALALQSDAMVQPLALALALVACAAALIDLSRTEEARPKLAATLLALLAAGFVTLWSANVLTMVVSWAVYDLLQAMGQIAAGGSAGTAIRGLILGSLATLFLWGGALLSDGGVGSELWLLMTPEGAQLTLWAVAGTLRLWMYPFHIFAPDDLGAAPSVAAPLFLSPVVGWGLWLRLVSANGGFLPDSAWVLIMAAVTLAVGNFLAWSCKAPHHVLRWVGMGAAGAVLLAAGLAGESTAAVIAIGGVAWTLGVAVLFLKNGLADGLQRESLLWSIPSLVGALALLGSPLTLGFVTEATLIGGLTEGDRPGWVGAFFIGNLFLVPSLMRWLLSSHSPLPNRRWPLVARGVGLGLLALPLIVAGLHPPLVSGGIPAPSLGALLALPGLQGWLLWVVSLVGGGMLAWQEGALRPKMELLLSAVHDLLRLEWLYGAVVGALDRGLSVLRVADEVVGGAGALLWSLLLFFLLVLVWGSE
jgi:formate hydrogenlyase subunit 3/multisubunit Na+/H+ antiporter MnhD subunit